MAHASNLARRLASAGSPGVPEVPIEVPDELWPRLLGHVSRQRITGLANAALREGFLVLTETQREQLLERHRSALAMVAKLEHLLGQASNAMDEAGVRTVVLKGAAVAHAFYPHASWRCYGDLDLLVPAADWRQACAVLAEMGFRRLLPEPRPGFDERFGKGASHEDAWGLQVDLHRTLALGPFGLWIDADALFDGTTEFRVGEMTLRRLDDSFAFIHACIHAALGRKDPQLMPLRDVAQIAWSGRVDWELTSDRARTWRLGAPVSHAFQTVEAILSVSLPPEATFLRSLPASRIERRALAAYTTDRVRRGGPSLAALWAIPGVRAKATYLRAMLLPDDRFLAARSSEGSGRLASRWMVPLRWGIDRIRSRRQP